MKFELNVVRINTEDIITESVECENLMLPVIAGGDAPDSNSPGDV